MNQVRRNPKLSYSLAHLMGGHNGRVMLGTHPNLAPEPTLAMFFQFGANKILYFKIIFIN